MQSQTTINVSPKRALIKMPSQINRSANCTCTNTKYSANCRGYGPILKYSHSWISPATELFIKSFFITFFFFRGVLTFTARHP